MTTQQSESTKRMLDEDRERTERTRAEQKERMKGKPTPTQDENDRAKCGEAFTEHEDDGSGPDPVLTRQVEAKPSGGAGYSTRQATPASRPAQHQPAHHGNKSE